MKATAALVANKTERTPGPQVFDYCDQWCTYCHAKQRCIAYYLSQEREKRTGNAAMETMAEAIAFTKEVAAATGRDTPELDALISDDPAERAKVPVVDDDVYRLSQRYALEVGWLLDTHHWQPPKKQNPATQPPPLDVVAWFALRLSGAIHRALVADALGARGDSTKLVDAQGFAKLALVGIDRSQSALKCLAGHSNDPYIGRMLETLEELRTKVEARFPTARRFMRPELDLPMA